MKLSFFIPAESISLTFYVSIVPTMSYTKDVEYVTIFCCDIIVLTGETFTSD